MGNRAGGRRHRALPRAGELNLAARAFNTASNTIVQEAWARGQPLNVHGWIYGLRDGLLRDLHMTAGSLDETMAVYHAAVAALG